MGRKTKTLKNFKEEAESIHNRLYTYFNSIYVNSKIKIAITCKKHGDFYQLPAKHLLGQGCPKCKKPSYTVKSFKEKAKKVHPKLDFSKTIYLGNKIKVKYNCKEHGDKEVYPSNLLSGEGCKNCAMSKPQIKKEVWIDRFKETPRKNICYNLIPEVFKENEKITFVCKEHGEFLQTPRNHYKGYSCPKCGIEKTKSSNRKSAPGWGYKSWQKSANKSKNFDSFKVYIIRCWNDEEGFYKIGKTFRKLKNRLSCKTSMPYNYEIIKIFEGEAKGMTKLEQNFKKENKEYRYTPKNKFNGMYECYNKISTINLTVV